MATPSKSKPSKDAESSSKPPATDVIDVVRDDQHQRKNSGEASPVANARGLDTAPRFFIASLVITVIAALVVWQMMVKTLDERLGSLPMAPAAAPASPKEDAGKSTQIEEQLAAMQKQLDAWRRDQLSTQKELRETIERVAAARTNAAAAPASPAAPAGSLLDGQGQPGVERMAEMVSNITPTQAEFIQLKERNRITAYADEAIATGSRKPLETLVEYIRGSGSEHLRDAAQAEYLRVVRMIQFYQREDPGFRLPVTDLFKGENLQYEADLKPPHLFKLLADAKQPWEVRVRAAILLKSSDSPETNAKLITAIKEDESLEVAKHAQIALEQRIQRRFRLLDIPAIEAWSAEQAKGTTK
ncbi:MAG: hypothetical protein IPK22_18540 [Verrucomicrobiaceae bacterium]|nr:hypothetical protein [Verrucomicrobiaceae bacterium]